MKKLTVIGFCAVLVVSLLYFAFADTVTLTTYYPAPHGVYNDLVAMNSVGIGTTAPSSNLDILSSDADAFQVTVDGAANRVKLLSYNDATTHTIIKGVAYRGSIDSPSAILSGDSLLRLTVGGYTGSALYNYGFFNVNAASDFSGTPAIESTFKNTDFSVNTDDLFVDYSTGNVGIGTDSPGAELHIYDNDTSYNAQLVIEQDGTGDAKTRYLLTDEIAWYTGVDNSDSNKFKITTGADFDSNIMMTIETDGDVTIEGTLTVNGDQTGAGDSVFDDYDDVELLRKWRKGEALPFESGDMLNRDRLLRDTIIQLEARIQALEAKLN